MGRLFWKQFLAFLIALLLAGFGVATLVRWYDESVRAEGRGLLEGPPAATAVAAAAAVLRHGGTQALKELLADETGPGPQLIAVDETGRELLDRPVPAQALVLAGDLAARPEGPPIARAIGARDGHTYLLFVPTGEVAPGAGPPPGAHPLPPLMRLVPILAGILACLGASALLAWYLSKPIRVLRGAFESTAGGKLDTRVAQLMGNRRDEIADLGRDFDRMAQRLESLISAQRRLLHDVSHELRSPLARLQVAIGLARQSPQKMETTLARVEREATRLDELVGELLTLSRLESGTADAGRERVDVADLLAAIAEDAEYEAQANGREVSYEAESPVFLDAHAESLHRAFENVVRNALKFTGEGGIVDISLRAVPGGCSVSVCDRGPGVPGHELEAIFEPFYRSGNDRSTAGTGLGLAIANRAVLAHGGRISASNRPGGGLCVEIFLPAAQAPISRIP